LGFLYFPRPGGEKCPPGVADADCPLPQVDEWRGPSQLTFDTSDTLSSSRFGPPNLDVPSASEFKTPTTTTRRGVDRVSRTNQDAVELGVSGKIGPVSLSGEGSYGNGNTFSDVDMIDLNGDGFPDILGASGIQYTDPRGTLLTSGAAGSHADI